MARAMACLAMIACTQAIALHAAQPLKTIPRSSEPVMTYSDELPAADTVIIPDKMPSFGLSKRENLRLSYMYLKDEPLLLEVFGLQMLFGALGAQAGLGGFVLGAWQFAPFASLVPGRAGNVLRMAGWHIFDFVISGMLLVHGASAAAHHRLTRLSGAWGRLRRLRGLVSGSPGLSMLGSAI